MCWNLIGVFCEQALGNEGESGIKQDICVHLWGGIYPFVG